MIVDSSYITGRGTADTSRMLDDAFNPCYLQCRHGADCEVTDAGNFYCRCNVIIGTTNTPFVAAGILCEYLATSWCIPPEFDGEELFSAVSFCTNEGVCKGTALPGEPHVGCLCQDGFEGAHCEYIEGTAPALRTEPPVSPPPSFTPSTEFIPVGQIIICPDGHRCEKGSICIEDPNKPESYYCDCSNLEDVYAGLYCQHIATSFCTFNQESSFYNFCTNGGVCNGEAAPGEAHLGCSCRAGYEGDHCEFVEGTNPANFFPSLTPTTATVLASSLPSSRPTKIESSFPSLFPSTVSSSLPSSSSFPSSIPSSFPSSLPSSTVPSQFPTSPSSSSMRIMNGASDGMLTLILTAVAILVYFVA